MAYKFQLGKAKLSGSIETAQEITSQGGLTVNGLVDLDAGVISNAELEKSSVMFNGVTVALGATGSFGTDAVTEGSTNKYYTDARVRAAVSAGAGLDYDSATGAFSVGTGEITNSMLSGAIASSKIAELNAFDTADLAEGSNLYYTDARARAAVSVTDVSGDGSLSYNSSTGVITYTGPSASEVRAHLSAGDGLKLVDGQFAVTSSIAGAGLAWSAGVLSVDTAEIAAGLTGSIVAAVADFVEGSDFVTFNDGNGTIGVDAGLFSGSARAVLSAQTGSAYQSGNIQYNKATGQITLQPVEESWVRQRLGAIDAVKYNSASGQVSLQLSGTSLSQNADGLKADLKTKIGAYNNSGSLAYNNANGEFTFSPVDPAWVKGHFSAGAGLDYDSATGAFSVGSAEVTNAMLAGAIENAKLVNSSVTVTAGGALTGGGLVALGSSITLDVAVDSAALEIVDDKVALKSTITGARTFTGNVIVEGNLTVTGSTTYVNTTELLVKDALIEIASGSAFAAGQGIRFGTENSLQTVSGFADVGNALSSSLPLVAPSIKAGTFYGSLEGSMLLGIESKGTNATISKNVTKATANITLTLPTSPVVGQEHRVKCFVDDGASPAVIVAAQVGGTIEGVSQVVLESYGAAVSLVWDGSMWMVF